MHTRRVNKDALLGIRHNSVNNRCGNFGRKNESSDGNMIRCAKAHCYAIYFNIKKNIFSNYFMPFIRGCTRCKTLGNSKVVPPLKLLICWG
jgi:hypothetical protein